MADRNMPIRLEAEKFSILVEKVLTLLAELETKRRTVAAAPIYECEANARR